MTAMQNWLVRWALGLFGIVALLVPAHAEDAKVRFILDWAYQGHQALFTPGR